MSKKKSALQKNSEALAEVKPIEGSFTPFTDDTTTKSGVSQEATPALDKKYGDELAKAFSHISHRALFISLEKDNEGVTDAGAHLDFLADKTEEKLVVSWPTQDSAWLIKEMAKRQFVVNESDTKYLRIAVRFAKDRSLKDSILVFNRRK